MLVYSGYRSFCSVEVGFGCRTLLSQDIERSATKTLHLNCYEVSRDHEKDAGLKVSITSRGNDRAELKVLIVFGGLVSRYQNANLETHRYI